MGTRGCIARVVERTAGTIGFDGVYHHWDSYPTGLGETLFKLYNGFFAKDIAKFLQVLIDDHPAGWSTINNADFSMAAGFVEAGNEYEKKADGTSDYNKPITHGPRCFCHGTRHEEASAITEKGASSCGCEWTYAFDEKKRLMYVLSSYCRNGKKMIGFFGFGDKEALWKPVAVVKLDEAEPDWEAIQKGGD
jgi:hypothetical protein